MKVEEVIKPFFRRYTTVQGKVTGMALYFRTEEEMNECLEQIGKAYNDNKKEV